MTHHYDNVRPLICPQVTRGRRYSRVADVIPLHPRRHPLRRWRAVGFAVVVATLVATALAAMLRGASESMGQMMLISWW